MTVTDRIEINPRVLMGKAGVQAETFDECRKRNLQLNCQME
ncbi:MAG: hypothetical protein AB1696_11875 [Planctomycetota bacterium]